MARRKKSSIAEDFIDIVSMLPWWAGILLALFSYVVLHRLASGATLGPDPLHMARNGVLKGLYTLGQYALPALCLGGAALSAWRRHQRQRLAEGVAKGANAGVLQDMTWREFEILVGEGFRMQGFKVEQTGGGGADGGIDLVLRKNGDKHLVQCKQWRSYKVGVAVVRELYGVMAAEGAAGGYVVTSGRFTDEAKAFASGRNVRLMDGDALFQMFRKVRTAESQHAPSPIVSPSLRSAAAPPPAPALKASHSGETAPPCPRCANTMVRRTAKRGANAGNSFWGCTNYPGCKGIA